MNFRLATREDHAALKHLYQDQHLGFSSHSQVHEEPIFKNDQRLSESLASDRYLWIVGTKGTLLTLAFLLYHEKEQGLCKIHRIYSNQNLAVADEEILLGLGFLALTIKEQLPLVDLLYCTTLTLSPELQNLTLKAGFKLLGIFPGFHGADPSHINGLSALFLKGEVLTESRYSGFKQHPLIFPFFELVRKKLDLPNQPKASPTEVSAAFENLKLDPSPELEMIHAPRFVSKKFEITKRRRVLSNQFYPFREPNALITDPEQNVEVFLKLIPEIGLATLIGERIDIPVHPADLYRSVLTLLRAQGITYVEVLVDAADLLGIECLLQAGLLPCVYFPAFKANGHIRRDYIVLNRSFNSESILQPATLSTEDARPEYSAFFREYVHLLKTNFTSVQKLSE